MNMIDGNTLAILTLRGKRSGLRINYFVNSGVE